MNTPPEGESHALIPPDPVNDGPGIGSAAPAGVVTFHRVPVDLGVPGDLVDRWLSSLPEDEGPSLRNLVTGLRIMALMAQMLEPINVDTQLLEQETEVRMRMLRTTWESTNFRREDEETDD